MAWAVVGPASAGEKTTPAALPGWCSAVSPPSETLPGATTFTYGKVGDRLLRVHVFEPADDGKKRPALLYFFGGGFRTGDASSGIDSARFLSARGHVVALADYRILCRDGVTALAGVADAQAANVWLRHNARKLRIDPTRIALGGASAGGLLAATTALRASRQNRPQALVLINPVLDLTAGAWAQDQTPAEAAAYSASSLPIGALPPTIIFHGTADTVVPIQSSRAFCARASRAGRICRLVEYPGMRHGFSDKRQNAPSPGNSPFDDTLTKSLDFLSAPSKVAP